MITKGAVEEMCAVCAWTEYRGEIRPLTEGDPAGRSLENRGPPERRRDAGHRPGPEDGGAGGYLPRRGGEKRDMGPPWATLAFLDPPKGSPPSWPSTPAPSETTGETKILTGDNERVTRCILQAGGPRGSKMLPGLPMWSG